LSKLVTRCFTHVIPQLQLYRLSSALCLQWYNKTDIIGVLKPDQTKYKVARVHLKINFSVITNHFSEVLKSTDTSKS